MQLPHLSINQFQTFLLLYAAHIDYKYTPEEEAYIKDQCSEEEYQDMLDLFTQHSEYGGLKIILNNKKCFLCDDKIKQRLYKEVNQLFKVDGAYSRPEKVFLKFIDNLMNTS